MSILCDWLGVGCSNPEANSQQPVVADLTRYIKVPKSGWLLTLNETEEQLSLCAYTKVRLIKQTAERTYFKVLDGPHYGTTASLKNENAEIYLGKEAPIRKEAVIRVQYKELVKGWYSPIKDSFSDPQMAEVTFAGLTTGAILNSEWDLDMDFSPIPTGSYKIFIPDSPHHADFTSDYREHDPTLRSDQVWFPIEYGNNTRYIHPGHVSHGCVTVHELSKWNALYDYLIKHRMAGSQYVGTLIVSS